MKKIPIGPNEIQHLSSSLRKLSFFAGISLGELEQFISITHLYELEPNHVVFKKGDVGDALYVVHKGDVKVFSKIFFLWPAKTIAELGPGEIFGEMALVDQPYRTATVKTVGPTQLFVLMTSNFNSLLNQNPAFAKDIRKMAMTRSFENKH